MTIRSQHRFGKRADGALAVRSCHMEAFERPFRVTKRRVQSMHTLQARLHTAQLRGHEPLEWRLIDGHLLKTEKIEISHQAKRKTSGFKFAYPTVAPQPLRQAFPSLLHQIPENSDDRLPEPVAGNDFIDETML